MNPVYNIFTKENGAVILKSSSGMVYIRGGYEEQKSKSESLKKIKNK